MYHAPLGERSPSRSGPDGSGTIKRERPFKAWMLGEDRACKTAISAVDVSDELSRRWNVRQVRSICSSQSSPTMQTSAVIIALGSDSRGSTAFTYGDQQPRPVFAI